LFVIILNFNILIKSDAVANIKTHLKRSKMLHVHFGDLLTRFFLGTYCAQSGPTKANQSQQTIFP